MDHSAGIKLVILSLLLALPAAARAQGLDTIPYGEDCWDARTDADADGLDDDCEHELAFWFMPRLWFHADESGPERLPHYAVKNHGFAARTVQILYLDNYYEDAGIITGHDGDSELQIIEVHHSDGRWYVDWVYLSAHRTSVCDSSAWYSYDQLEYDTGTDKPNAFRGWPTIYVAEDKHATYNSLERCDRGCLYLDRCGQDTAQFLDADGALAGRNVGSTANPLIDEVVLNGATERLLDAEEFAGWDDQWFRGNAMGYRPHLDDFGF